MDAGRADTGPPAQGELIERLAPGWARDDAELLVRADRVAAQFAPRLVAWQQVHGRHDLPWQTRHDPYRVWLSEIMLQQTQVATVLGYYTAFLQRFPDVQALAAASLDEVLSAWAGLGYYSRARNLHRCAQTVVAQHHGRFPADATGLATLPGIGPSTAAAIAAFCFNQRAAILDGNVKRVLSRVLGFAGDLAEKRHERALWQAATRLLPADESDMPAYTQGVMDLGASLCSSRRPQCPACPVAALCEARRVGAPQELPVKTRRTTRSKRENWWLWLEGPQGVWLEQRPARGVWAGLWSLPLFDAEADLLAAAGTGARLEVLPPVEHALTHFDWLLHPRRLWCDGDRATVDRLAGRWVSRAELARYGLPAPLRRLLG